jgi:Flp pilus assembly protein TadB
VSQEQQNPAEQQVSSVEDHAFSSTPDTPQPETAQETELPQSSLVVSGKKRKKKKGRLVSVEEIMPKPSYWPLALAVSFIVLLVGIMISWIVIVVGAVLVIVSVMGWSLERR